MKILAKIALPVLLFSLTAFADTNGCFRLINNTNSAITIIGMTDNYEISSTADGAQLVNATVLPQGRAADVFLQATGGGHTTVGYTIQYDSASANSFVGSLVLGVNNGSIDVDPLSEPADFSFGHTAPLGPISCLDNNGVMQQGGNGEAVMINLANQGLKEDKK